MITRAGPFLINAVAASSIWPRFSGSIRSNPVNKAASTSFALIVAIRISAYYSEDLSKDVAKLLPFVLLGIFLVDPTYFNFEDVTNNINSLPGYVNQIIIYIIMIILVEWILRIALTIRYKILPKKVEVTSEKA